MSDAIIVNEIVKKFGKPADISFWKYLRKLKGQTGKAKSNGKGKMRLVVAVAAYRHRGVAVGLWCLLPDLGATGFAASAFGG